MLKRLTRRLLKRGLSRKSDAGRRKLVEPLFDAPWYLANNPQAGPDPLAHYLDRGWREGRRPNPFFDPAWYLARHPDVAEAGREPLSHYAETGWREDRLPSAEFDATAYLALNPDIAEHRINPLEHYLRYGRNENRRVVDRVAGGQVRGDGAAEAADATRRPAEAAWELIRVAYWGLLDREPSRDEFELYGSALAGELTGAQMLSILVASEEFRDRFRAQRQADDDGSRVETNEPLRNVLAMAQAIVHAKLAQAGVRLQLGPPSQLDGSAVEIEERIRGFLLILSLDGNAAHPGRAPHAAA